ncbi:ABC transporter permease [Phocicoccus pinnipedialis]|uniref:Putative hemin transport system permease protein HrtB n=1 Tax=Phocicoccus pinnipedialis TaxID=110845 RepID=A0A6V7R9D5_9BACL|nr:ABC transporter permease [Jeotgalicoccus pinnipedialis]MBP1940153.1 putative ABC transport system permease protein [Jeotgalicoccus pinnipedialis]CAD2073763.1 FtsX-like permease family protein [Jeotgalicoccus pinnipedialis]
MFLAWNEIKKNKLRFILIIGVLMLVSYLVFFLSGLATGLKDLNRESVDKWQADGIILTEESDKSLLQSSMNLDQVKEVNADESAVLGQISAIAREGDKKANIALFGIRKNEFLMPNVVEGKAFSKEKEVVASDALKEEGFKLGDTLELSSSEEKLKIVGFTNNARFNAAPVLYANLETFQEIKFGKGQNSNMEEQINAIVVRGNIKNSVSDKDLEVIEIETFIENLPGYTEQNLTLTFMIYFLFIISSVIVAIFLYVLTVQKISMFGLMKAQGISNLYLAKSVIAQTFILAFLGVAVGFILTLLTGQFLPAAVPVSFDIVTMLLYGIVLIVVAILGAVFSVLTIFKIDPLKAIGG